MADEATPLLRDPDSKDDQIVAYTEPIEANASSRASEVGDPEGSPAEEEVLKPKASIRAVMVPMMLGIFLVAMDQTIVTATYASIGSQFESLQNTSWIATGYMLTLTSFQPLYGKLSDIFGRKACLIFAYAVFALGSLFCGLARSMPQLIVARAVAGIGGGGMSTVATIIMSDVVPLRKRGTWQGIANIAFASGSATGAPLGGVLADTIGWRWAFLLQVPLTVLAILSVALGLRLPRADNAAFRAKLRRVDFGGAFTLVLAVFALLLALDRGANAAWRAPLTLCAFAVSALAFALFALVETRVAAEPLAPRHIVASGALLASYLCNLLVNGVFFVITFHVPLFLQAVRGLGAARAGAALIPCIAGGVSASVLSGLVMQATGRYYWLTVGAFGVTLAGAVLVALEAGAVGFDMVWLCVGLFAMNFGGGASLTTTLIALIANAGPADQAVATAVSYLFRSLGSVVFLSLGTTLSQEVLRARLRAGLSGADVDEIIEHVRASLAYVGELPPAVRAVVREAYAAGVQAALWFAVGLAGLGLDHPDQDQLDNVGTLTISSFSSSAGGAPSSSDMVGYGDRGRDEFSARI
ncbi:Vacuolar membrane amino acid uptake transporter fnx2 [Sparassis crispa]|uniref:Vacuolar membrane amino acid uptake transporter fnx2 n=1 Tax=Sparassis crispa TaxID=139825 RepID=A0A401H186_9APHY|nr:Vacuolar membrane amino acid uptake transporter fnx2 [Sparassis crispa]GBE88178.1 Vacuolar membrane amino acid uptake transporter fnx2 [Sparassis crispa]